MCRHSSRYEYENCGQRPAARRVGHEQQLHEPCAEPLEAPGSRTDRRRAPAFAEALCQHVSFVLIVDRTCAVRSDAMRGGFGTGPRPAVKRGRRAKASNKDARVVEYVVLKQLC